MAKGDDDKDTEFASLLFRCIFRLKQLEQPISSLILRGIIPQDFKEYETYAIVCKYDRYNWEIEEGQKIKIIKYHWYLRKQELDEPLIFLHTDTKKTSFNDFIFKFSGLKMVGSWFYIGDDSNL